MRGQREEKVVEDVPRAPQHDRAVFVAQHVGRTPQRGIHRHRPLFRDRQREVGDGDDALAQERLLARVVHNAKFAQAPKQERESEPQEGHPAQLYCGDYLRKSTAMVAVSVALMVTVTLRSGYCGFRNTISRMPSRMEMLASGVSPA